MKVVAIVFIALMLVAASEARDHHQASPAPAPAKEDERSACMEAIMNDMITCVDYMLGDGTDTSTNKPDKACCSGTKIVLKEDPNCLCLALAVAPDYGIAINITRASALPALCHVPEPPSLSKCLAAAAKVPAPEASSPVGSAPAPASNDHHNHHDGTAPAPAPASKKGASSTVSVSYGLMTVVALLVVSFSV